MGRRKKDTNASYKDIISSSYVRHFDYEKAQIVFSSLVNGRQSSNNVMASDFYTQTDFETFEDDYDID